MTPSSAFALCSLAAGIWPKGPIETEQLPTEPACAATSLVVSARYNEYPGNPDKYSDFTLHHARFTMSMNAGPYTGAHVAFVANRHTPNPDSGAELWFAPIQLAYAELRAPQLGAEVNVGIVDDPWVRTSHAAWAWRPIERSFFIDLGWNARSDLGAAVAWTSPSEWVSFSASFLSGEGPQKREQNSGKNTIGLVVLRPFASSLGAKTLEVTLYGQEGSIGPERNRNHRLGTRISGQVKTTKAAFEWMTARGTPGAAESAPSAISTWTSSEPWGPLVGVARLNLVDYGETSTSDRYSEALFASGVRMPGVKSGPKSHLVIGVEHSWAGEEAARIRSTVGDTKSTTVFLQVASSVAMSNPIAQ